MHQTIEIGWKFTKQVSRRTAPKQWPTMLLGNESHDTLPIRVFAEVGRHDIEWQHDDGSRRRAATLLAAVVFSWLQRHVVTGPGASPGQAAGR